MKRLFKQFSFPGRDPQPSRPKPRLDPRGGRTGLRLSTPSARPSTTRISSSPASSAMARPRPVPWPRAGTATSSSTPPRRRGPADPALERLQDRQADRPGRDRPGGADQSPAGLRIYALLRRGARARADAPAMARRSTGHRRDPSNPGDARAKGSADRSTTWPMIVLKTPKGWTRSEGVDGVAVEGTFQPTRCPFRGWPIIPGTSKFSKNR